MPSCLGTAKFKKKKIEKKGDPFDYLPSFCWTYCQNLLHDQLLLDFFWLIH